VTDPRERLRERRNPTLAAARLEASVQEMRDTVTHGPETEDPAPGDPVTPAGPAPAPFNSEHRDPEPRAGEYGADYPPAAVDLPGSPTPALNWRPNHDQRSRSFGVRQRLTGSAPLTDVLLSTGPVLNQGAEGACVGFGSADAANVLALLRAPGTPQLLDSGDALELYRLAQKLDQVPGEDYEGSSVLGGMKAGLQRGLWGGYLWAFGTRDIAQALLQRHGPVVIGVPWYEGLYETGPRGVVRLGGALVGGHCLAVVGLQLTGPNGEPGVHFVWQNSWGPSYGDEGLGYIANRDLAALLRQQGEAAIPTPGAQVAGR
jgi:hypothetical protein